MDLRRPFRFAVSPHVAASGEAWRQLCRRAEDLGYSTLLVPDHFGDQFALLPALTSAAEATTTIRVGALVACNDYRHPVMHAKELATLDVLSGGRVEWGMGAGWLSHEYEQVGLPFDPPGVRVGRMQEAIAVMRGLFADGACDHAGIHYTLSGADGRPKPLQRPHPPLLIGAAGERMLSYAGREADIIGLAPSLLSNAAFAGEHRVPAPEMADRQLRWIREAAGPRFDEIELNMVSFPSGVTPDRLAAATGAAAASKVDPLELLASPHTLLGTVEEICDALEERRERWQISYWSFPAAFMDMMAPVVERLAGR